MAKISLFNEIFTKGRQKRFKGGKFTKESLHEVKFTFHGRKKLPFKSI